MGENEWKYENWTTNLPRPQGFSVREKGKALETMLEKRSKFSVKLWKQGKAEEALIIAPVRCCR